jgi:hypothetical protein
MPNKPFIAFHCLSLPFIAFHCLSLPFIAYRATAPSPSASVLLRQGRVSLGNPSMAAAEAENHSQLCSV